MSTINRSLLCALIALLAAVTAVALATNRAEAVTPGFASAITDCGVTSDVAPDENDPTTVGIARENTRKLNDCIDTHDKIEFDAGHTYLIGGGVQGRGVTLQSDKHIKGNGAASKLILNHIETLPATSQDPYPNEPKYKATGFGANQTALSNVTLENLYMEGRSRELMGLDTNKPLKCPNNVVLTDPSVTLKNSQGQNCRLGGAVFIYNKTSALNKNVRLDGVEVYDWPGLSVGIDQSEDTVIENSTSVNPNKGGFVLSDTVDSPTIANNISLEASDGAIGLNATKGKGRFVKGEVRIHGNTISTRRKGNGIDGTALHGTAIVIRGIQLPRDNAPDIYDNEIFYSINNSISIIDGNGVDPENITISNNRLDLNEVAAIKVQSVDGTTGIKVNDNIINKRRGGPSAGIAFVKAKGGGNQRWTNSEAFGNDLNGRKVYVEPGIKGIKHQ